VISKYLTYHKYTINISISQFLQQFSFSFFLSAALFCVIDDKSLSFQQVSQGIFSVKTLYQDIKMIDSEKILFYYYY